MTKIKSFEQFLNHIQPQKEISIAIAQDEREINSFEKILIKNSFKKLDNISELLVNENKVYRFYFVVDDQDGQLKNIYDFLIQYPTGQVEIFDQESMRTNTMTPDYAKSSLLFLATQESISKIKEKGYDLLSNAGLTYQT